MMSDVTITTTEDAVILDTPYHPAFPAQARKLSQRRAARAGRMRVPGTGAEA